MLIINETSPVLTSEKIILRRPDETDICELKELFDQPLDETKAHAMLQSSEQSWREGKEYILGVIAKDDGKLKGIIEMYGYEDGHLLIGYRTMPAMRHRGYASEAVYVLVHHLIQNGIHTVYAAVQEHNEYSQALLRHNGFEQIEKKDGRILFAYYRNPGQREEKDFGETMKVIYLAAGCFWGSEKAFKLLDGVVDTMTGYANGTMSNPRYEDVCRGNTGFRETVRIVYDPAVVSLETIMKAYFLCIDPTVANRQGNDIGSQYQTGVYYTDEQDAKLLKEIFEEEKKKYDRFFVELEPLKNFYTAEEYHQNYLGKNPWGYCHSTKTEFDAVKALNKKQ